jgi:formylglycine-generating enzyme required for sulfatase activity
MEILKGYCIHFLFLMTFFCLIFFEFTVHAEEPVWEDKLLTIEPECVKPPAPEGVVFVRGGCFDMGDDFGGGDKDEKPVHEVCVDEFYMGQYEVTVGEFKEFVNATGYKTEAERGGGCLVWIGDKWEKGDNKNWKNPGFLQDDSHPVCCVSWNDAVAYTEWLSGKTGKRYRLPTEAEWEYAARSGGMIVRFAGTSSKWELRKYAWYDGNSKNATHPVGQKRPNGLCLYDITGNVWEWCSDWYGEDYYRISPKDNPKGPLSGKYRVLRGGSWFHIWWDIRSAFRNWGYPVSSRNYFGFRVVIPSQ